MNTNSHDDIYRLPDGSINFAFYVQRSHRERSGAYRRLFSQLFRHFRALIGQLRAMASEVLKLSDPPRDQIAATMGVSRIITRRVRQETRA